MLAPLARFARTVAHQLGSGRATQNAREACHARQAEIAVIEALVERITKPVAEGDALAA